MTWTAPPVTRSPAPRTDDEWTMLTGFLDWQRVTLLSKCTGLTGEQLAERSAPPSALSLLGIVRHLSEVERAWFRRRFRGQDVGPLYGDEPRRAGFHDADPSQAEADFARFAEEVELARQAIVGASLEDTFTHAERGVLSLRWVMLHMIEEYARHLGHVDLLRERIDGAVGV
ncbi:MAG: DinB family protein [bacterium]|jgi:uncharacterized damage-inducible protein DinB|nr:DinB family protein [bacterium]